MSGASCRPRQFGSRRGYHDARSRPQGIRSARSRRCRMRPIKLAKSETSVSPGRGEDASNGPLVRSAGRFCLRGGPGAARASDTSTARPTDIDRSSPNSCGARSRISLMPSCARMLKLWIVWSAMVHAARRRRSSKPGRPASRHLDGEHAEQRSNQGRIGRPSGLRGSQARR